MVGRNSPGHLVGSTALTQDRLRELEASLAIPIIPAVPSIDRSPIDPAWLAAGSCRRRGRLETTSEEDVARAAKFCRLEERRYVERGAEVTDAEMYKLSYRSLEAGGCGGGDGC